MRRHFLFAEDERERSVGEGKVNLLRLWHNRRSAMLEGDESASGGEANAQVARELTLFWDLAKPMSSCTLSREGYIGVFARVAKALVLPLSTDPLAVPAAQRDWEYDLEGTGGIGESTKGTSSLDNELMTFEQFREAVMQLAEIILPVESAATLYVEFFRELRNSIAELVVSPSTSKPEQDENISAEPVDRFMLRPLNRVPKITKEAFLQKLPPSSDALRSIRGLQPPDQREMSLKQLLLSYNPRKFSLTRAFPKKKTNATANGNAAKTAEEQVKTESADVSTTVVEDSKVAAKRLHMELRAVDHKLRIRRRKVVTPPTEDEDSVGDTPPTTETTGTPEQGEKANNENADDDEEMDRAFRDEDFDALCAGNAIARSTALALLRLEATRSLLAGVGVVMDDVYPYELSTSENAEYTIATDYLVALTALPDELECQLVGSELTPTAGRLYSVRELALLKTTNPEELAARGFADFILPPKKMEVEAEELQETNDPAQSSDAGPKSEEEEIEEATPEDAENDDGAQVVPEEALPPPEPTPAERNEIEPPTESSLPFGSIALAKLAKGFREYVARMENELAMYRAATTTNKPSGYHLVAVLAVQSLNVIRDHCIQAITGTSLGLSRFSTSREAYAVSLPEDLNGSSRAEKVRESAAAQEEGGTNNDVVNALSALRREQFQVEKTGAEDISQGLGGAPRVITCPLFRQPSETLAAIERELNPLAPRLDSIEDGQAPQLVDEYDPAVIFVSPLPNQDDETSSLPQQDGLVEDDAGDPEAEAQIKAARSRALQLQGEFGRFCPVSWSTRGLLIPGLPSHVCCFRQQFYAFAGESERHAFERNPSVFIPTGPRATSNFTPCVLLLGVRGSGRGRIAAALAQTETEPGNIPSEFVNVDLVAASNEAERNQLQEELKPEEVRLAQEEIFIRALQRELYRHQRTPEKAVAQIIAGLGLEASRIPTTSTLETCFKLGLFPTLVIPLTMSEDDVVNALLSRWASNLPAPRRKLAFTRKREDDGDAEGNETPQDGDEEEEPPIDVEAAREEESTRLREQYTEDQKALEEAIAAFRARGVKVYKPVDATSAPRQTIKHVRRILNDFMAGREALFERCDISAGDAMQKMLASGELLIGKHGLACPVTGRTDPLSAASVKAVVYRDQLYFPRSREARRAFLACPSRYLDKASLPPRHQVTCCIVGAPLSGKTRVTQELANALGVVYVSPQNAVEWVLQCQGGSTLRHRLLEIREQQQGNPLSNSDLIHESICTRLRSSECQARGWVLDGYLLQHHELHRSLPNSSAKDGDSTLQPDMLFVLERGFSSVCRDHHESVERNELRVAFARWYQYRLELLDVWTRRFGSFHVRQLDSFGNSLWHVAAQAQSFLEEQQHLVANHTSAMASDRAACSLGVVRSREVLQARQHPAFQTFCPVELRAGRFYHSRQSCRELCVDFRGFSFWLGNQQNLEQFLASPEAFVGYSPGQIPAQRGDDPWPSQDEAESEAQSLVARTPVNASLVSLLTVADCDFPEMKGYCPVTFALGSGAKDWASLRHGSVFYRASYRSKVYFFVSEEARRKFCTEPSRYTSQSLPVKLPPQVTLAKSYPGQLEQQLGAALNEVLLALGSERPKFPQMSIRASACVYLALTLKALQRRYQLKVKPDPRSARDEDESDEEQKQRQERREEQAERDAVERRDAFVRDCRLGEQLKAAITPAYPSCGSGVKVARSMRAAQDSSGELQQIDTESGDREVSAVEEVELLRRRFDVIISGCDGDNTPLPTDPHSARMNARAAFIEYTKTSTPS
ncbi:hypothetical protein PF010_g6594 [Phytophthora fragariae]|uniref:Cilia- and flagella-associated protein 206 n=1 Tax=Phytophthora fragariae TaxID=53985 RepID=A0A6G0LL89_9STRA|nr:hypothetical protein PF010_g6594 [Phytophthora fragariae]